VNRSVSPYLFAIVLFVTGVAGGALNSVAGGGSFIVFPTMIFGGISPIAANATTAVALWPAGLSSLGAYRKHIPRDRRMLVVLAVMSALGGGLGAKLLLFTSDATFARILPFLMLAAASIFTFGPRLTTKKKEGGFDAADVERRGVGALIFGAALQLIISTYGGYFGGGMGIMMLATFTLMGMHHMHQMNAIKVIFGLLINGVALVTFIVAGKCVWTAAIPVAIGALVGGWTGASLARSVDPKHIRKLVLVVAWLLTAWFFYRAGWGSLRK
jgi:uncharacterized protein